MAMDPSGAASSDEAARLRQELDAIKKRSQDLAGKITARNATYMAREEELTSHVRSLTEQTERQLRGQQFPDIAGVQQQVHRANRALQNAEATQNKQRSDQLLSEISEAKRKLEKRQGEEQLAATALARLHSHISSLEDRATRDAEQLSNASTSFAILLDKSYQYRTQLARRLNLSLQPPSSLRSGSPGAPNTPEETDASEAQQELCPQSLAMDGHGKRLKQMLGEFIGGLTEEAELRAAVFRRLEESTADAQKQLDEQNVLLSDAQGALKNIAEEVARWEKELEGREATREQRVSAASRVPDTATLQEAKARADSAQQEAEFRLREATRRLERAELESETSATERKTAATHAIEAESAASKAKEDLEKAAARRAELEAERMKLERAISQSKANVEDMRRQVTRATSTDGDAEVELTALRSKIRAAEDKAEAARVDQRQAKKEAEQADQLLAEQRKMKDELEKDSMDYKSQTLELRSKRAETTQKMDVAKAKLEQARANNDGLRQELDYAKRLLPTSHPSNLGSRVTSHSTTPIPVQAAAVAAAPPPQPVPVTLNEEIEQMLERAQQGGEDPTFHHAPDTRVGGPQGQAARTQSPNRAPLPPSRPHVSHSSPSPDPVPHMGYAAASMDPYGAPVHQPSANTAAAVAAPVLPQAATETVYPTETGEAASSYASQNPANSSTQRAESKYATPSGSNSMDEINKKLNAIMNRRSSQRATASQAPSGTGSLATSLAGSYYQQ